MQIFELFGSILLKDNDVEKQLDKIDKKAKGTGTGFDNVFGKIGSAALKLGAILGAGLGIKTMIDNASLAEDRLAQMDSVLESTGGAAGMTKDQLLALAASQGQLTKFSKGANEETENLLLTFTNIGQKTFPDALKSVNDMSQALGQDTKSSAIQLGKALNDPIKGITALSRVGVTFTQQQKDQIATMVKAGDIAGAQSIILKELQREFGGSAEAAGKTFGGQLTILQNNLKGVGTSIAMSVMPYLTEFLVWINAHMPQIQAFITNAMKVAGDAIKSVADFIKVNVIPALDALWKWIQPNIPAIKEIFRIAFDAIKVVLKVVGDYINNVLIPIYASLRQWFEDNFPKIKAAVMAAYNYIKPSFDNLVKTVKEDLMPIIMGLLDTVKKAMPGMQAIFSIVFPIIVGLVTLVINIITNLIKTAKGIYDVIKPALDSVANIFSGVFGTIKAAIQGVIDLIHVFNGIKLNNKSASVDLGVASKVGHNALGTDNWEGGLTEVNEAGGEIIDLPSGSRVIPHDVSMEMAKNNKKTSQPTIIQLVLQNGKVIAEYLLDSTDNLSGDKNKILARGQGICMA